MCASELAPPLSTLFALCFSSQHQPLTWKEARVFPIYTGASWDQPSSSYEDVIPQSTDLAVYADDTTLYQCLSAAYAATDDGSDLQLAVDAVSSWGRTWKVTFEPSKSQALMVSHTRPIVFPGLAFDGIPVAEKQEVRLHGVLFDRQLSFRAHIRAVTVRTNQHLQSCERDKSMLSVLYSQQSK